MHRIAAALALCAVVPATVALRSAGQDPAPQPQPAATFRSTVELIPVDVDVMDRSGRPVPGLRAEDFVLTVDGRPRRIASAEYIAAGQEVGGRAPSHYSSNADTSGGRLVMIVIDQTTIVGSQGKRAIESAQRFIAGLRPSDRVGLTTIPGAQMIDFTTQHEMVRTALHKVVGLAPMSLAMRQVGLYESLQINRRDERAIATAMSRECAGMSGRFERESCRREIMNEASSVYAESRGRTLNVLSEVRAVVERLQTIPARKTVVFMSGGLIIDQDPAQMAWFERLAAQAQITFHAMHILPIEFDASQSRLPVGYRADLSLKEEGLGALADMGRGSLMRISGNADHAFERLGFELSGYYMLGFEPDPADRDDRPHRLRVELPGRGDVAIRARREFSVGAARVKPNTELLAETLRAPLLAAGIGLKTTTYTLRDHGSSKLRVIVATEIDRTMNPHGAMALAYGLVDANGTLVATDIQPELKTSVDPVARTQYFWGAAAVDRPGVYGIKVAVVDDMGRRGSVEHAFRAELAAAGDIGISSLLIGEDTDPNATAGPGPAVSAELTTDTLHGLLELYSDSPEMLRGATVTMEVAEGEQGRALDSGITRMQEVTGGASSVRVAAGAVPVALLPPGDYVARAVVNVGGRKVGQVTRPFRITRPALTVAAPGTTRSIARGRLPIPFNSRIETFDRQAVLAPQVVGFFLDRMNIGARGEPINLDAIEHARGGRFDAALQELQAASNDHLAAVFLTGLAFYAKGDLPAAMDKFRQSLKIDSEFFPAAFYLGSCYAAGGLDREAAGAWQTSLITEGDAPFVYTLLGDALLRLRDMSRALDILKEASTLWPDDDQVRLRYGTALSMAGRRAEALATLDPYIARHPEDHERLFVALRTIYEAHAGGKGIGTAEEDRQRFAKYAEAYAAAGGAQTALVEQWRRFLARR
jgi:VWFA-related protein